uniref:Transposase MuDR plant domain-containing protein n=1 Tax=Lactuca sativa TaxID=4236 RepID=A0A9R1VY15_LACSA|nr:hypothetical protein LSAT_V11C400217460 [Lactuca sativa]
MASQSSTGKYLTVDVHYSGLFAPNPLKYLDPEKITVHDVDFGGFTYKEFLLWLRNLTKGSCDNVYYCSRKETLGEGIIRINSDVDYWDFVETTYTPEAELDVYIDHQKEPILDWADNEVLSDGNTYDLDENEEEDNNDEDDNLDDIMTYEHEVDEEVHTFNKTVGDDFLNKLSVIGKLSDDEEPNYGKDDKIVCYVHDKKQKWDKMVPIIGMNFANPMQLKLYLTNYAVKIGYDLWYEKSDHNRLLVKCCKSKKNKKNKGCPFRLWATWISNERSFQIKYLTDNNNCSKVFKFGSIVSYKWIGSHFMNEILQKPKMSVRKLKAKVSKTFNLIASIEQSRNARRYAFKEIEGTLKEHYAKTWSYGEEIRRNDPGSTVKMDVDAMLDGTTYFSKLGRLLDVVGRDANNHIYPLDWAVVAVESKETWKWFVELLLYDIGMENGHGLTLISNQHKGLLKAVKERVPAAEHRQCARHICANFMKKFKGHLFSKLFWDLEDYVSPWLTTTMLFNAYTYTIKPLNGSDIWPDEDSIKPLPSKKRRMPRRPSTKRKRDQIESKLNGNKHIVSKRYVVMRYNICKVKVEFVQEVDVESDSDSKVQSELHSEVESYEVDFEDDNHRYKDVHQPEVEVDVQGQGQGVVGGVEAQGQGEGQEGQEGEEHAAVQDPIREDDQGHVAVQNPVEEELMLELPSFLVLHGKRRRKPSERIAKIQIRKKWEGKQWSSGENPFDWNRIWHFVMFLASLIGNIVSSHMCNFRTFV